VQKTGCEITAEILEGETTLTSEKNKKFQQAFKIAINFLKEKPH